MPPLPQPLSDTSERGMEATEPEGHVRATRRPPSLSCPSGLTIGLGSHHLTDFCRQRRSPMHLHTQSLNPSVCWSKCCTCRSYLCCTYTSPPSLPAIHRGGVGASATACQTHLRQGEGGGVVYGGDGTGWGCLIRMPPRSARLRYSQHCA